MADYFVGIDLGGTNLRCVVTDKSGAVISRGDIPTQPQEGVDAVMDRMASLTLKTVVDAGLNVSRVAAGAVAVPGPVDSGRGIMHSAPNMPGWISIPVSARLTAATGIRFFLENDANAAAWGEFWLGEAAKGRGNLVLLTLGTGIGGAVIINGALIEGRDGTAGELGHICVVAGGRKCGCGADGCIEAYSSATAILSRFHSSIDEGRQSVLAGDAITCADIFHAAAAGDALASDIVRESGYYLGVAVATLANALNPECCLVGGGVAQAGSLILEPLRQECQRRCYTPGRNFDILPVSLGADAGLFGAAGRAMARSQTSTRGTI